MSDPRAGSQAEPQGSKPYWVYLLECEGGSYYCGIALDPHARFAQHQAGEGAAYTRSHRPVAILACKEFASRSQALKAEYAVKQLPRGRKLAFFEAGCDDEAMPPAVQAPRP